MNYTELKIIASLVVTLFVISCSPLSLETTEFDSPDGYYTAELTIKDRGSCCSPSASITLYDNQDRIGESEISIFEGIGGWPIELHWIGPREMIVVFCDARYYEVKSGIYERNIHKERRIIKRIKIQVVTLSSVLINGQKYCGDS